MGSSVYSTVVAANGNLYITNRNQIICVSESGGAPKAAAPKAAAAKGAAKAAKK